MPADVGLVRHESTGIIRELGRKLTTIGLHDRGCTWRLMILIPGRVGSAISGMRAMAVEVGLAWTDDAHHSSFTESQSYIMIDVTLVVQPRGRRVLEWGVFAIGGIGHNVCSGYVGVYADRCMWAAEACAE